MRYLAISPRIRMIILSTGNFKRIIGHKGPLNIHDKDYKRSRYYVLIEWLNRKTTFESLSIISKDTPVPCTIYARKKGLLDTKG